MSWPRTKEGMRLYRERCGAYLVIIPDQRDFRGHYDAIANVRYGPQPSLCSTGVSPCYLRSAGVRRVSWDELPKEWKQAFWHWLGFQPAGVVPRAIRGFWRV